LKNLMITSALQASQFPLRYRNLSSFNVAFKNEFGITPSYFMSQNKIN
jgi:AraC-like DNA-binding protein